MKIWKVLILVSLVVLLVGSVSAQFSSSSSTARYIGGSTTSDFQRIYGSNAATYWPILNDRDSCEARDDLILQISPAGCQPSVVRSDLLAEQDVPVFCQIDALQINPLIDIDKIKNIRFDGDYPEQIRGVGFHPARAALRSETSLQGSPLIDNIGYVVVILKKTERESDIPDDLLKFTLKGRVEYEAGNAFGVGRAEFLLREQDDATWESQKNKQSFWNGEFFVRLEDVDLDSATIALYAGKNKVGTRTVDKGGTSSEFYVPGSYCQAGLQIAYDGLVAVDSVATINVDGNVLQVSKGSRFFNNKCSVVNIKEDSGVGSVEIMCGSERIILRDKVAAFGEGDLVFVVDERGRPQGNRWMITSDNGDKTYDLIRDGTPKLEVPLSKIRPDANLENKGDAGNYYDQAITGYENVAQNWEGIKGSDGQIYSKLALEEAIKLAGEEINLKTKADLIELYIELGYDNGYYADQLNELYRKDKSLSVQKVDIDNRIIVIELLDLDILRDDQKAKAELSWGGKESSVVQGAVWSTDLGRVSLNKINGVGSVDVTVSCSKEGERGGPFTLISSGNSVDVCGGLLFLRSAELDEIAKVRILPNTGRTQTESEFTVGIGIEKRAIELTPEKAQKRIDNLQDSIDKWEGISDNLGDVVSGMKAACFATAGVLTINNFLDGTSGESLARQQTMQGPNGWTKRCEEAKVSGKMTLPNGVEVGNLNYFSVTDCINENQGLINEEVSERVSVLNKVNDEIANIESQNDITKKGFLESRVEVDEAKKAYLKRLQILYPEDTLLSDLDDGSINALNYQDLRAIHTNLELGEVNGGAYSNVSAINYGIVADKVNGRLKTYQTIDAIKGNTGLNVAPIGVNTRFDSLKGDVIDIGTNGNTPRGDLTGINLDSSYDGVVLTGGAKGNSPYKQYAVVGVKNGNDLDAREIYEFRQEGNNIVLSESSYSENLTGFTQDFQISKFLGLPNALTSNEIKVSDRVIRYFDSAPYEGFPAQVPIDVNRGYYVKVDQVLAVGNNIPSYTSAGEPKSYNICNVGSDGFIDDGDVCQRVDSGYNGNVLGLDERPSADLIKSANEALRNAASKRGNRLIEINGAVLEEGTPINARSGSSCQEFMSPKECQLLFNVCDPVICPSSRCDFGGAYPVSDVIQTGIVGGVMMCLPNWNEGVYVPLCLSGIHAGIESYTSILQSHQQCLQESIDTGQLTGICDEITSVYTCEFFWRQAAPLVDVAIPKLFEYGTGNSQARGGGEYAFVQGAWGNTQDSIEFFTQEYAVNSLDAFRARSTSEVGGQFCNAFISSSFPTEFDTLLEPDSPTQFHAYYSSTPFSDATVPATSQYKVFYHIFAGNDRGVSYSVYLKDPPQNSYYQNTPTVQVVSGFIGVGEFETETRDFTAPEGYKQLCVRIDNKEECGFKQVTTSFALNQLTDRLVADEVENVNIQSASECVSGAIGSGLPLGLINANPQEAVEESLFPQISERGVVRVCADENPGGSINPNRYKLVGSCGESGDCWLDSESVKDAISDDNKGVLNGTLVDLGIKSQDKLREGLILQDEVFNDKWSNLEKEAESLKDPRDGLVLLQKVDVQLDNIVLDSHRAAKDYLIAKIYAKLHELDSGADVDVRSGESGEFEIDQETQTERDSEIISNEKKVYSFGSEVVLDFRISESSPSGVDKFAEPLLCGTESTDFYLVVNDGSDYANLIVLDLENDGFIVLNKELVGNAKNGNFIVDVNADKLALMDQEDKDLLIYLGGFEISEIRNGDFICE